MRESVVTRYLQSLRTDLDELNAAIEAGDVSLARRRAHQIAGASRMVGAHAVAERAARLEQAAEDELQTLAADDLLLIAAPLPRRRNHSRINHGWCSAHGKPL